MFLFDNSHQEMCIKRQYLLFGVANIALKGNFKTKAFAPPSTLVNSRGIITVAANLNIQRGPSMSKPWGLLYTQGGTVKTANVALFWHDS